MREEEKVKEALKILALACLKNEVDGCDVTFFVGGVELKASIEFDFSIFEKGEAE